MKRIKVERKNGGWRIELDHAAMTALISMVRTVMILGWWLPDRRIYGAGRRLWRAVDRAGEPLCR